MAEEERHKVILTDDGRVTFNFMTCLENITMAKVVSSLWMTENTLQDIVNLIHSDISPADRPYVESWIQIINNIAAVVAELPLPKSVIVKLSNMVPDVGNSILQWISYHECILDSNAVNQISHIKWTARGKIDYAETAKEILEGKDTCLSEDHRLKLACTYCLEDEIAVTLPNVVHGNYLDTVRISQHPMVYYWAAQITGDYTKFFFEQGHPVFLSSNDYVMQLLINNEKRFDKCFNEVAIKYMWEKLDEYEKEKRIVPLVKELRYQELKYTLLSNLDLKKQQEVFKEYADTILLGMLNDWLWKDYFLPTALYLLNVMHPSVYLTILREVLERLIENSAEENIFIFKQLWENGARNFKEKRNRIFNYTYYRLEGLLFSSSWVQNLDVYGLIIYNLNINPEEKREIILKPENIKFFECLIKNGHWDLLGEFESVLSPDENIKREFKKRLIKTRGFEIGMHFLQQNSFDKTEHFMSWACKSAEEMYKFRKQFLMNFPYMYRKIEGTLKEVLSSNNIDLASLDNHIYWCADGDLEVINEFKAKLPKRHYSTFISDLLCKGNYELLDEFLTWCFLYDLEGIIDQTKVEVILKSCSSDFVHNLIEEDKYERLDQFLNWCFSGDQLSISQFKSNMCYDYPGPFVGGLIISLIQKDGSLKMLDKFATWAFTNRAEVQKFRTWLLYTGVDSCIVSCLWLEILKKNQFDIADKCIKWCVTSQEDVEKFKKSLMLSCDFISFCSSILYHCHEEVDFPLLIKWINPSKELIEAFKDKCLKQNDRYDFPNVIYGFLQSHRDFLIASEGNSADLHINLDSENSYN